MARPPRGSMYGKPRTNSLIATLWLLVRAVFAYALAFWLYVFLYKMVYGLRDYGVTDTGARSLIFFVLLIIVIVGLLSPLMQEGTSGAVRITGVMTGFVLLILALTQAANLFVFDATAPVPEIFRRYFAPWLYNLSYFRH